MRLFALALLLFPAPALAQQASVMNDEAAKDQVEPGQELETRTDGDLNGDGQIDIVIVGRGDEARTLKALMAVKGEFDIDFRTVGTLKLEPTMLGPANVSIAKGILKVEDLTGGTTAIASIYRYRLVPGAKPRMRLIGLDATYYSRTYAHDGFELSWNLLTGDLITREMRINKEGGDAAYDKILEKRVKRPSKPIYMEDTPDPEALIESAR